MYKNKKERLYIADILPDAPIAYPAYYILSAALIKNELLQQSLIDIHSYDFSNYATPKSYDDIFASVASGLFPVFKEKYAVGYFGAKLMYLESHGWKAMPCTKDVFVLDNWLVG